MTWDDSGVVQRPAATSRGRRFTAALWTVLHAGVCGLVAGCSGADDRGTAGGGAGGSGGSASGGSGGVPDPAPPADHAAPFLEPDHVLDVAIEIAEADWDALRVEARSSDDIFARPDCQASPYASPFTWKEATVTIDGRTRDAVGVRKKGFLGSLSETKPSLKISLDHFITQNIDGVEDFTLNNAKQDPSYLNQCLGYRLVRAAGVPAPRCNFATVTVNGEPLGAYVQVEPLKKPLLRQRFSGGDGDLYEGTLSDFRDGWFGTFEPKTTETDPAGAVLREIADAAAAPANELLARLSAVVDVDAFASLWAIEVLTAHWDGYAGNTNNFYVYRDPQNGLVTFLPWGADQLFGTSDSGEEGHPVADFTRGVVAHALYRHPEGRVLLFDRLRDVLDTVWDEVALSTEIDRMNAIVRPLLPGSEVSRFDGAVAELRQFVSERRQVIEAALDSAPTTPAELRDPICFQVVGTVSGTFATTWGTAGTSEPFSAGTATLDAVVDGETWIHMPGFVSAVAGPNTETGADRDSQLVIPALQTNGMLTLMAFGFDRAQATVGSHPLDLATSQGVLIEADPNVQDSERFVGIVLGGELVFDAVGTTENAPVSGRFNGTLYMSGLFGE